MSSHRTACYSTWIHDHKHGLKATYSAHFSHIQTSTHKQIVQNSNNSSKNNQDFPKHLPLILQPSEHPYKPFLLFLATTSHFLSLKASHPHCSAQKQANTQSRCPDNALNALNAPTDFPSIVSLDTSPFFHQTDHQHRTREYVLNVLRHCVTSSGFHTQLPIQPSDGTLAVMIGTSTVPLNRSGKQRKTWALRSQHKLQSQHRDVGKLSSRQESSKSQTNSTP